MARRRREAEPETVEQEEQVEPEEPEEPKGPEWPLGEGQAGFYRAVRSSAYVSEGEHVAVLQRALGVPRTGVYDDVTLEAVRAFNAANDLPGAVADRKTWDAIFG